VNTEMVNQNVSFNLTQIIESLDVSPSSVSENVINSGAGGEQFSMVFATAIEQVREQNEGIEAAVLSKSGKNLPLSGFQRHNVEEELARNAGTLTALNQSIIDGKVSHEIQVKKGAQEEQVQEADSEVSTEFKLHTVRFMNGRKVLTSIVDQGDLPELSENYNSDLHTVEDDIFPNYSSSVEIKSLLQDAQFKSLPLWWQKQNIQSVDHDKEVSLAGRMAVSHGKQASITAVTNKKPIATTDKIALNSSKYIEDASDSNMSELAGLDVVESLKRLGLSEKEMNRLREYISDNPDTDEIALNSSKYIEDASDSNMSELAGLDFVESLKRLGLSEKEMNRLREYISDNPEILEVTDNAMAARIYEVFSDSNLGKQVNQNLPTAMNSTDISNAASMNSNLIAQVTKNLEEAMNVTNKIETIVEQDESMAGLMVAKKGSIKSMEAINSFDQPAHVEKSTATIFGTNASQYSEFSTNLGMTQHQESEVSTQAIDTKASFFSQGVTRPQFGEQLMRIVAREIDIPKQDGIDTLRIEITPPDLGDLEIELRKQGKELEVRILASTEAAADAIKDHSSVLKNILGNQDFSRVQVNVDIGKREHSSQQEQGDAKQGDPDVKHEQRFVKVRIHDGVIDTFV